MDDGLFLEHHKESSKPVVTVLFPADSRVHAGRLSLGDDIRGDGIEKDWEANYLVSTENG